MQIDEERKEAKGKGERERYIQLNAEFQRIARRDKKAFLSEQCKVKEENKRMGKTRDLFKKIRDAKGTFHVKMGTVKKRNAKSKMAVWGGLTNSCEKKRSEKQRRKGKTQASECRVPKNSKKR